MFECVLLIPFIGEKFIHINFIAMGNSKVNCVIRMGKVVKMSKN